MNKQQKNEKNEKNEKNRILVKKVAFAAGLFIVSLTAGILGYRFIAKFSWWDSILNASNILSGMGPMNALKTDSAKFFASTYALYSGIFFLVFFALVVDEIVRIRTS